MRSTEICEDSGGAALVTTLVKHYKSQWMCITFYFQDCENMLCIS